MRATYAREVVFTIFQTTGKSTAPVNNTSGVHVMLTVHYKGKLACAGVAGVYESDGTPE